MYLASSFAFEAFGPALNTYCENFDLILFPCTSSGQSINFHWTHSSVYAAWLPRRLSEPRTYRVVHYRYGVVILLRVTLGASCNVFPFLGHHTADRDATGISRNDDCAH